MLISKLNIIYKVVPKVNWYRCRSFGKRFSQTKIIQNVPPPRN